MAQPQSLNDLESGSVSSIRPLPENQLLDAFPLPKLSYAEELFQYAKDLRDENAEPWFFEMTTLRRFNFADLNNKLAQCKKKLFESEVASEGDICELRRLLHEQGTTHLRIEPIKNLVLLGWQARRGKANAIRDFEYIRSLDFLPYKEQRKRFTDLSDKYFPDIGKSDRLIKPFETENYRRLAGPKEANPYKDEIRYFLCQRLRVQISYSKEEKNYNKSNYDARNIMPTSISPVVEIIARLIVAMVGALFILVPTIVMSFDQSRTKSLVTTSVAVLLFAIVCSVSLRTENDQTLAATAGYAAVLMVFVGLTS